MAAKKSSNKNDIVHIDEQHTWQQVLAAMRTQHPTLYRKWFEEDLQPLPITHSTLAIQTQSPIQRDYLTQNCKKEFSQLFQELTSTLLTIRFLRPGETIKNQPRVVVMKNNRTLPKKLGQLDKDTLAVNPDFDFDAFIVGQNNQLAHAAAQAVAAEPGQRYNPLFIHGDVGLGKTHLLQAICLEIAHTNPNAKICYLSCEGFIQQFMDAIETGQMSDFKHRFRNIDILLIDDIQTLGPRNRTQEELFHTFNALYQSNRQIVLSSDAPPENIPDLQKRLVSRFQWGVVAPIEPPCFETRLAIIKSKARLRDIELPDDVVHHIAASITTNIRELEGAIGSLQVRAAVDGKPIDLAMAKEAIVPAHPPIHKRHASIQNIVDVVTDFFGVKLTDLQSKHRARSITTPRQVCMYLARHTTPLSLEEIGGFFGGRDHTTVMHAVRAIQARCDQNPSFKADVEALHQRIAPDKT